MAKTLMAVFVVLVSACGPMDLSKLDEAAALVWEHYGAHGAPMPSIDVWHQRCVNHHADGACVDGIYNPNTNEILVGDAPSWSASSLAHELYHADEMRRWGDPDNEHRGRGWSWYVPEAEDLLRGAGL